MIVEQEKFPVSDVITVVEGKTVYKTEKWWQAVILGEAFGRRFVAVYLWQKQGGRWKRIHKLKVNNLTSWKQIREIIDNLIEKLSPR